MINIQLQKVLYISFIFILSFLPSCTNNTIKPNESEKKIDDNPKKELTELDIKNLFLSQTNAFVNSYEINNRKKNSELGGGWCQVGYRIDTNFTYDIEKTNSIVSPYKAVLKFNLFAFKTEFHKSKVDAVKDNKLEKKPFAARIHTHYYEFKNNEWRVVSRKNKNATSTYISNCDEVIKTGPNSGEKDIFGCWE